MKSIAKAAVLSDASDLIGPGAVVLIVGPSGAGKDAVLGGLRARLGQAVAYHFPKRVISRPAHPSEEFISTTPEAFAQRDRASGFAVTWHSHGLAYGISNDIDVHIQAGTTVVFNTSRSVVAPLRQRYQTVRVVMIDAPPDVRAVRLAARGRETREDVAARLKRAPADFTASDADLVIVNDADLKVAVDALEAALIAI